MAWNNNNAINVTAGFMAREIRHYFERSETKGLRVEEAEGERGERLGTRNERARYGQ